jgi:hypothetical protein
MIMTCSCTESPKLYYFHIKESPTDEDVGLGYLTTNEIKKKLHLG